MNMAVSVMVTAFALSIISSASAATLVNGSLTGPLDINLVPPGWSVLGGSPDTNDVDNNVGGGAAFVVPPTSPSPDGGTWVGLGQSPTLAEIFGQTITDFVVGQEYTLSWFAANFGAVSGPGYDEPNAFYASLDGNVVGSGSVISLGPDWVAQSISFTATSMSHLVAFGLADETNFSYLSIDGISLSPSAQNPIPVPAAAPLMLAGFAGLTLRYRRRSV